MRPIRITLQAFQSYLERQTIDFSSFGESGIFLITGNNGAGKSTIFQAMYFALYGQAMDSDHVKPEDLRTNGAPDDLETRVEFEFEAQGKTYRLVRTPPQSTASRRGGGLVRHDSTATIEVLQSDGTYALLPDCKRPTAVTNKVIKELVHLDEKQFQKVVLIPQGTFREILTDSTDSRQKIYRELFHTKLYADFLDKLKERTDAANRQYNQLKDNLNSIFNSLDVSQDSGYQFAEALARCQSPDALLDDRLQLLEENHNWYDSIVKHLGEKIDEAEGRKTTLNTELSTRQQLDQVESDLKKHRADLEIVQAQLDDAIKQAETLAGYAPELKDKNDEIARLNKDLPLYTDLESFRSNELSFRQQSESLKVDITNLQSAIDTLKAERDAIEAELKSIKDPIDDLNALHDQEKKLDELKKVQRDAMRAKTHVQEVDEECGEAEGAKNDAEQERIEKEEIFNRAREAMLASAAGTLAQELVEGKPCPVCGSLEHPAPATLPQAADAGSSTAYEKALKGYVSAKSKEAKAITDFENSKRKLEEAREQVCELLKEFGCTDYPSSTDAYSNLSREIGRRSSDCQKQRTELEARNSRLKALRQRQPRVQEDLDRKSEELTQTKSLQAQAETNTLNAQKQIRMLLSELPFPTRAEANARIAEDSKRVREITNATANNDARVKRLSGEVERLKGSVESEKALADSLSNPGVRAASAIQADLATNANQLNDLRSEERISSNILSQVDRISAELAKARPQLDALLKHYTLLANLSGIFRSTSAGENGRISLESYVQAQYLDSVLDRANQRLMPMTSNRYSLVRAEHAYDKKSQSGLDIDITDAFQGTTRKSSACSTGESFMASLSMALGLADLVCDQSGASEIECMLIDEGFGSLDRDHLQSLLELLVGQTVAQGKVLVGIISHVEDLIKLIPDQIQVTSDQYGHSKATVVKLA